MTRAAADDETVAPLRVLLERDDLKGTVARLHSEFETSKPSGMRAARTVAIAVLRADLPLSDPYERISVAGVLAVHGDSEAMVLLEKALEHSDPLVRHSAADALARVGTPRAIAALRHLYEGGFDERKLALATLALTDDVSVIPVYLDALRSPDTTLRLLASRGLALMRSHPDCDVLERVVDKEQDPLVVVYLGFALAAAGQARGDAILRAHLRHERADVRGSATGLIGSLDRAWVVPELHRALRDTSLDVRASAGASLTRFHDRSGLDDVQQLLESEDFRIRIGAASSLGRMDYRVARPLILRALRSADPDVRAQAVKLIGDNRDHAATNAITRVIRDDPEGDVRAQGVLAMAGLGDANTVVWLTAFLPDPNESVRHAAAESVLVLTRRLLDEYR